MVGILNNLQNKKTILDALKTDTILALEENNCNLDVYDGKTKITPKKTVQMLDTAGKYMTSDITVEAIPSITVSYDVGSNHSGFVKQQTRFAMSNYASLYSYYKITNARMFADWMTDVCTEIYFSTERDQVAGNMEIGKEYPTSQNFVNYVSGSRGCFYRFNIMFYN